MKRIHKKLIRKSRSYAKWHMHPMHQFAHFALFIILGSLLSFNLIGHINKSVASENNSETEIYTEALLEAKTDYKWSFGKQKDIELKELIEVAKERQEVILREMETNPEAVINSALTKSELASLPKEVKSVIEFEEKVSIKGQLELLYLDMENGKSEKQFFIKETGTNERLEIHIDYAPKASSGDFVKIDGVELGNDIATTQKAVQVTAKSTSSGSSGSTTTSSSNSSTQAKVSKKVAIILVNFQDDKSKPFTASQVESVAFTHSNSASAYFKDASFGQLEIIGKNKKTGDVYDWVTVPFNRPTKSSDRYCIDTSSISNAANQILTAQGKNMTGYDIMTYYMDKMPCGWVGLGYVGGTPAFSWIFVNKGGVGSSLGTLVHEWGHNIGFYHASSYTCKENGALVSISKNSNCSMAEYGDPFNVMGNVAGLKHFSAFNKGQTGNINFAPNWLASSNVQTVDLAKNPDSTYTIYPISKSVKGVQSLRIPRTTNEYYYLEYRQPSGYDNFASNHPAVNGISIRIGPDYNTALQTRLIDTNTSTSTFDDAPLATGKTFTDSIYGISIETKSVSSTNASVRIYKPGAQTQSTNTNTNTQSTNTQTKTNTNTNTNTNSNTTSTTNTTNTTNNTNTTTTTKTPTNTTPPKDTTPPSIPKDLKGPSKTTNTTPTFTWTASTDNTGGVGLHATQAYSIQMSTDKGFSTTKGGVSSTNSFKPKVALTKGTWYIRVKSRDNLQNTSEYSNVFSFVIE
jgi:hypothetical protein